MTADFDSVLGRCPLEIWITILRLATEEAQPDSCNALVINAYDHRAASQRAEAVQNILRFTTVSKTWHAIVQPFLFQWIRLRRNARGQDPHKLGLLLQKEFDGRPRGVHVQRLTLHMSGPEWLDKRQACIAVISQCTRLEEFECESPIMMTMRGGGHDVGADLIRALLDTCRGSLRRVFISGKQMHPVHLYTELLSKCPRLEHLECACWNLDGWSLQVPSLALSVKQALWLQSFTWVTGHTAFMQFFSDLQMPSLRKVYISDESPSLTLEPNTLLPEVDRFFRVHGTQLLSVELSDGIWLLDHKQGMASAILAHCPNLESFAFNLYACQPDGLVKAHDHLRRIMCYQLRLPPSSPDMDSHLKRVQDIILTLCRYRKLESIRCMDIPTSFTSSNPDELSGEGYVYRKVTQNLAAIAGSQGVRFEDRGGQHMADGPVIPKRREQHLGISDIFVH
ncbi:hypothetical protein CALCODRAFT_204213 [Calocera cornea HHB12733]|uniref:F-box domain-containing protein n=1 Tax=Calocera cornea HHB12733 TaxID=1353952 RepID=A0A165JZF8_9BASI|nr:hypothetical protein CALCODRAFT_204213 [Calocera cornea HHB12733]